MINVRNDEIISCVTLVVFSLLLLLHTHTIAIALVFAAFFSLVAGIFFGVLKHKEREDKIRIKVYPIYPSLLRVITQIFFSFRPEFLST
jgi:hypothetical protein